MSVRRAAMVMPISRREVQKKNMIDLFKTNFATLGGSELLTALEQWRVSGAREGFMLDFKQDWKPEYLKTIAAMANTLGGILVVGVEDDSGCIKTISGVTAMHELKTQIANSIATGIAPTPQFDIAEARLPGDRAVAAIRVAHLPRVYLVLKNEKRHYCYVRNEDATDPVSPTQLRMLIDREYNSQSNSVKGDPLADLDRQLAIVNIGPNADPAARPADFRSQGPHSSSYLLVSTAPSTKLSLTMTREQEDVILRHLGANYSFVGPHLNDSLNTEQRHERLAFFFEYVDRDRRLHAKWATIQDGKFGFVTQNLVRSSQGEERWSVADTIALTIATIRTAHEWWVGNNYYGEAEIRIEVQTLGRDAAVDDDKGFPSLINPSAPPLDIKGFRFTQAPSRVALARRTLTFAERTIAIEDTATNITIELLRGLGFSQPSTAIHQAIMPLVQWKP